MHVPQWSMVLNYLGYNVAFSTMAYDMRPHKGPKQRVPPHEMNDKICRPQHYDQCLYN